MGRVAEAKALDRDILQDPTSVPTYYTDTIGRRGSARVPDFCCIAK